MEKPVIIVGVPTISKLFRGLDVHLEHGLLIPDDQLHNLARSTSSPVGSPATSGNTGYLKLPSLDSVKNDIGFGELADLCQTGILLCYETVKRLGNFR